MSPICKMNLERKCGNNELVKNVLIQMSSLIDKSFLTLVVSGILKVIVPVVDVTEVDPRSQTSPLSVNSKVEMRVWGRKNFFVGE